MSLDTFCEFQQSINTPNDNDILHHDYAIMITRFALKKTATDISTVLSYSVDICFQEGGTCNNGLLGM